MTCCIFVSGCRKLTLSPFERPEESPILRIPADHYIQTSVMVIDSYGSRVAIYRWLPGDHMLLDPFISPWLRC